MLRLNKIKNFSYGYNVGDKVEFYTNKGFWVKGEIIDFKITDYVYKAVIKCETKNCKFHYVCICSTYLRRLKQ